MNKIVFLVSVFLLFFSFAYSAKAQESLTLSISPSLFDMSVNPGQEWRSSLKIINVNNYDLTVYLDVVNFLPQGEGGEGKFVAIQEGEMDGSTLAEWFSLQSEPVVIPPEQSMEIPFAVRVPFEASPGGHFAAILVGTKPLSPEQGQARVQTSQMVTSLFFARVAGDITELGSIREFNMADNYLNSPEATFQLRFENKGNVHLQPQGDIRITNMWGQERGIIPINQGSQFGNVLPESIRKFTFSWKGEWSIADIGRYSAVATLAYGTEERQFTSAKTNFWVIPYKLLLGIFTGLALFVFLLTWLVKIYVRHTLVMAGIDVNEYERKKSKTLDARITKQQKIKLHTPIQTVVTNLRLKLKSTETLLSRCRIVAGFCIQYRLFLIAVLLIVAFLSIIIWYVISANTSQRNYEVTYVNSDKNVTLTSEEIIYNQLKSEKNIDEQSINDKLPKLNIVNRSGIPGMGAETRLRLEALGYEVIALEIDFTSPQLRTVIIYSAINEAEALKLSGQLNNAPISVSEELGEGEEMTIFVGSDVADE